MKPIVQNIIASSSFPTKFNLFRLSQFFENCTYTPEKFSALFLKITNPKCTVLIFGNGKIVLTGLKTKIDCRKTILRLENLIFDKEYILNTLGGCTESCISLHISFHFLHISFHFLEQIGGAHQPIDFYEIVGHDGVHVRRFNAEGMRYTIRFRNMDQVVDFPGLVPQIFQDLIDRVLQNVRKLLKHH
jgi:hypothetical protein